MTPSRDTTADTILEVFPDERPLTLEMVAEELSVPEDVALLALERLEEEAVLVRAREGTDRPVWRRRRAPDGSFRTR